MKQNINRWIFQIPLSDVKSNKEDNTLSNCCMLCGKRIKGEAKHHVHLLTSGNLVSTDQEFSEKEDQGFFPVGPECKNKLPNNFIF